MTPAERVIRLGPARSPECFGAAEALLAAEYLERVAVTLEGCAEMLERWRPLAAEEAKRDAPQARALAKRLRDVVRLQEEARSRPVA